MLNIEQRQPRLERMKCLLEKQHRFNSKMHSIELHRARIEQEKPRRDLPLNKLAVMTSRSSFVLPRSRRPTLDELIRCFDPTGELGVVNID